MKNHWIRLRRQKQFKAIETHLGTQVVVSPLYAQVSDTPIYKMLVKVGKDHVCTIWLNPDWKEEQGANWWVGYYVVDRKQYLQKPLPEYDDPAFWGVLETYFKVSLAVFQTPETLNL